MQKTITLDQQERQAFAPIEMENLQLHARSDILNRELKGIETRLAMNEEQQRKFIQETVVKRGIEQFARAQWGEEPGSIVVTMPDEPMTAAPAPATPAARPNGSAAALEAA
jgi:hypothetical protein